jgi:hypothetical protein
MSLRAHISILLLALLTLGFILQLVRRHRLKAKYSVLWVSLGLGLAILASAPMLLERFSDLVGIKTPAFTFLLMAITFLLVLALHFSWELSRLEDRTRALAEECALLRERVERTAPDPEAGTLLRSARNGTTDHEHLVGDERRAETAERPREPQQGGAAGAQQAP